MRLSSFSVLFGASAALTLPAGTADLEDRSLPLFCLVIDVLVTVLETAPSATPFCSSFLGVKTSTVYTTTTATSYSTSFVTSTTGTDTLTAPTVTVPTVTVATITAPTTTITETASATTVTTCVSAVVPKKRHDSTATIVPKSIPTPDCLLGLLPSVISEACSCISVPTPTSTSTVTNSAFPTTVVTTNVAATATVTPLVTPFYTPVVTPSTTVTVTPTSTVTYCPSPTPDTSCNNQGVQWAYYPSKFGGNSDGIFSQFDPTYFKTVAPLVSGTAGSAGGISGSCPSSTSTFSCYGNTENCNNFALNYRGYLYAGQTGTFKFTVTSADDIVLVWAGANAFSGWTRPNALLGVTYSQLSGSISATYSAVAGEYIPMRIMFSQGGGPFGFNIAVTAPDGTVVLSAGSTASEFLVQFSCDGTTAPPYAPFGQET